MEEYQNDIIENRNFLWVVKFWNIEIDVKNENEIKVENIWKDDSKIFKLG